MRDRISGGQSFGVTSGLNDGVSEAATRLTIFVILQNFHLLRQLLFFFFYDQLPRFGKSYQNFYHTSWEVINDFTDSYGPPRITISSKMIAKL